MKILKHWLPPLATVLLCGCFQVEDELSLQPDGSGKVTLALRCSLPEEVTGMMGMASGRGGGTPTYPPSSAAEARLFFPAKDFTVKIEAKTADTPRTLSVEAAFKDVNALLASPYGRAHQLTLKSNADGTLKLQALSGGSLLAQMAQFKPEGEMAALGAMPGFDDAQKQKGEMRFEFRVVMPNAVTAANGQREDKKVTWAVARNQCKDDEEFGTKVGGVLEASCSLDGIKFSPVSPPRLGLLPFAQLTAGKIAATTALPDTNKIAAAARFVPYLLRVSRVLDLSGEGGEPSQAELTGAILLPAELAPQRWGEAKLEEATDAKGNSLMPKADPDGMLSRMHSFNRFDTTDSSDDDDPDAATAQKEPVAKPHVISLSLKAPEWKVKKIAKIKGSLDLLYLGGSEVIKLSNAVPASLVMDPAKGARGGFEFGSDRGPITDSRLTELELGLQVQMAMVQGGMTMLSLATSGKKTSLVDAQVFDAEGRPWPTTLMQQDSGGGEDRSCEVMVAGKPKPPFSLAIVVGGVGASVSVPILVENVPVAE